MPDSRYEIEDEEIITLLRLIASRMDETVLMFSEATGKPKLGFGLFLFETGTGGAMFWISNADRSDMMRALREFLQRETPN